MSDLVRVLRGQRIDGRGADEIMRRAADEIDRLRVIEQTEAAMRRRLEEAVADCERLREKLADRIEERDDSNRNLTAALQRESKLQARLAEAEKDATRSRHEWQRECEDTDLLLQGMGLCPSEYRSECGSLLLARIRHKMGHIGLRLDETLARLAEVEAERDKILRLWLDDADPAECGYAADSASAAGRIAVEDFNDLRKWIQERMQGGCRVFSKGGECRCPLCLLERIAEGRLPLKEADE